MPENLPCSQRNVGGRGNSKEEERGRERKRELGSEALAETRNIAKRQVMSPVSVAQW